MGEEKIKLNWMMLLLTDLLNQGTIDNNIYTSARENILDEAKAFKERENYDEPCLSI